MKIIYAVPLCAALLVACGDENTTEVNERTGLQMVAEGEKMDPCTKDNEGEMVLVTESATVYYCADGKWATLDGKNGATGEKGDAGEKGEKGDAGADGKATDGTGCTAEQNEDGSVKVSCDGKVVGTLTSGTGADGKSAYEIAKANGFTGTEAEWTASLRGETCSAKDNGDGSVDISCGGEYVGTVRDGKSAYEIAKENGFTGTEAEWRKSLQGENCTVSDTLDEATGKTGNKVTCDGETKIIWNGAVGNAGVGCTMDESKGNGVVELTCGEGENAKTVTLYKAMCGTDSYDPKTQICYDGRVHDKESFGYDPIKNTLLDYRDSKVYKTVTIEIPEKNYSETWMAQNLNYAYTGIPFSVIENGETDTSDSTSWCVGDNGESKGDCSTYGRLYTWAAAIDSVALADDGFTCGNDKKCDRLTAEALAANPIQGICPAGWHLPSSAEWLALQGAIGDKTAASALKSASGWNGDGNGIDSYGFSALPAGYRMPVAKYEGVGISGYFWTSTQYEDNLQRAFYFYVKKSSNSGIGGYTKYYGRSVRCIKNKTVEASN